MLEGEPLTLDVQAVGIEVAATEARDVGAEFAKARPFELRIQFGSDQRMGGSGIVDGNPMSEFVVEGIFEGVIAEVASPNARH